MGDRSIILKHGHVLIVDEADIEFVNRHQWHPQKGKAGAFYAIRFDRVDGKQRKVYLHRVLTRAKRGQKVDHISGNGLDNRRSNLRI
jgi:hypothetical protein